MKNWARLRSMRGSLSSLQLLSTLTILVALAFGAASEFRVKPLPLPGAHGLVMLDYFAYDRNSRLLWVPAARAMVLRISDLLADQLWQTIPQSWPEKGQPEPVAGSRIFRHYFLQWSIFTAVASAFFIIVPRIAEPGTPGNYPPVLVAILFPAIVIGLGFAFEHFLRRR